MREQKTLYESCGLRTVPIYDVILKKPSVSGWAEPGFDWNPDFVKFEGIGILTGYRSGVTVVDFDKIDKDGPATPEEQERYDLLFELLTNICSMVVQTQHGGRHLYFKYDARLKTKWNLTKGVDVRNDGALALAPPTTGYHWLKGCPSTSTTPQLEILPYDEIEKFILVKKSKRVEKSTPNNDPSQDWPETISQSEYITDKILITKGTRNNQICTIFGRYKAAGLNQKASLAAFDSEYTIEYCEEWNRAYLEEKVRLFWSEGVWEVKEPDLRTKFLGIYLNREINHFDRNVELSHLVLPYIYTDKAGTLFIFGDTLDTPVLLTNWLYSIGMGRNIAKDLYAIVKAVAEEKQHPKRIVNYYYHDEHNKTIYFNTTGGVVRVDSDGIQSCERPDDIVFAKTYPYSKRPSKTISDLIAFQHLDQNKTPNELAEWLIRCWLMSVIFKLRNKALLLIEGDYGCGKTTLASIIVKGLIPDSEPQNLNKKELAFQLSRYDICLLDNLEARYADDLKDIIAMCSTGGLEANRKLFTDNDLNERVLSAHAIFTSKSGLFSNRPDIAGRLFPIHMKKELAAPFSEIDVEYWASVVFYDILDHLPHVLRNDTPPPQSSSLRNACFVSFCVRCGFDLEKYSGVILNSQTDLGEQDLIADLYTVLTAHCSSNRKTETLRSGHILESLKKLNHEKYSKITNREFGCKLKKILESDSLRNRFIIEIKQNGSNLHYNFKAIND